MARENVDIARDWASIWEGVDQVGVIGRGERVPALEDFNKRHQHPEFTFEIVGEGWLMGRYSGKGFKGWREWVLEWANLRHEYGEPVDCGDKVFIPTRQVARSRTGDIEMDQRSAAVLTFREGKLMKFQAYVREQDARKDLGLDA